MTKQTKKKSKAKDRVDAYLSNVNKHTIDSVKHLEEQIKDFSKESEVSNE